MRKVYDIAIAADNLNTFSCLLLRKIGLVKKVIYYTVDYTPRRFSSTLLNRIYHAIDRYCCYHADLIWNSSVRMDAGRKAMGVNLERSAPALLVVDGTHVERIHRIPRSHRDVKKIAFIGHLIENKGVELLIDVFDTLRKHVPGATLLIIGTGPMEEVLRQKVSALSLSGKVTFTGRVEDHRQVEKLLCQCGVAVAPYVPDPKSFSYYSDVGKPKLYLACGLPVVITRVPEIAIDIERNRAGYAVAYEADDIVAALKTLLTNPELYREYRANAVRLGSQFSWERIFASAFSESFRKLYETN